MHARIQRRILPATVTARLTAMEKELLDEAASRQRVTISEYVRQVVVESLHLGPGFRLVLGEICATRREIEMLLTSISDLDGNDIDRATSDADKFRAALIQDRVDELQERREVAPLE